MHEIDDISSILTAVNEINLKSKKKNTNITSTSNFIPKLNKDSKISPDIDRLILEAEKFKKKSSHTFLQVDLSSNKNNTTKIKDYNKIIEDPHTQIIINLNLKIKYLQDKLENFQTKTEKTFVNEKSPNIDNLILNYKKKDVSKADVIKSLKIQDSVISDLKKTEEKLRFRIVDLEQNKTIFPQQAKKAEELNKYKNNTNGIIEKLKSIYKQVERHKKIFTSLKNYSVKINQEVVFFKENYKKLIVENNEIKKRLSITKQQIVDYENNKLDLLSSINQLNQILSKTNIAANISPSQLSSEENIFKKNKKD